MSRNILISLIGAEPTGNYRAYKEFGPNLLIHVYSAKTEIISERILSLIDSDKTIIKRVKIEGDNYSKILDVLNQLDINIQHEDHVNINVTGGTKMMSLAAIDFGKQLADKCKVSYLYTDITTQQIHWFYENTSESFCEEFELEELITLRGQKIKSKDFYTDILYRYQNSIQEINDILNNHAHLKKWDKFLEIVAKIRKVVSDPKNKGKTTFDLFQKWIKETNSERFEIIWSPTSFQIAENDIVFLELEQSIEEINWFIFNAGWFELVTAQRLAKKHNSNNIYMNVTFPVLKDIKLDKNEVDILINDGGKLIFVECKSGSVSPEAINSMKVREETYGGSIGESILVTRYDQKSVNHDSSKVVTEKSKELGIQIIPFSKL